MVRFLISGTVVVSGSAASPPPRSWSRNAYAPPAMIASTIRMTRIHGHLRRLRVCSYGCWGGGAAGVAASVDVASCGGGTAAVAAAGGTGFLGGAQVGSA